MSTNLCALTCGTPPSRESLKVIFTLRVIFIYKAIFRDPPKNTFFKISIQLTFPSLLFTSYLASLFLPWKVKLRLEPPYTEVSRLSGPEIPKKVSKKRSRTSRPGVSKKCRKSPEWPKKESKRLQNQCSGTFSTLFWHSGPGGPGTPFWDFLGILGLGGVETPVYGDCNRKGKRQIITQKDS